MMLGLYLYQQGGRPGFLVNSTGGKQLGANCGRRIVPSSLMPGFARSLETDQGFSLRGFRLPGRVAT